jgi:hypothetical protein
MADNSDLQREAKELEEELALKKRIKEDKMADNLQLQKEVKELEEELALKKRIVELKKELGGKPKEEIKPKRKKLSVVFTIFLILALCFPGSVVFWIYGLPKVTPFFKSISDSVSALVGTKPKATTNTSLLGGCSEAELTSKEVLSYIDILSTVPTDPSLDFAAYLSGVKSAYDNLPFCVQKYIKPYHTPLFLALSVTADLATETDLTKMQEYADTIQGYSQDIIDNTPLFNNLRDASKGGSQGGSSQGEWPKGVGSQSTGAQGTLKILDPNTINSLSACYSTYYKTGIVYTRSLVAAGGSPFKGYTWSAKNLPMGTTIWPQTGVFTSNGGALNPNMPEMMVEVTVSDGTSSVSAMLPFKMDVTSISAEGVPPIACPEPIGMALVGVPGTALEDAVANKPYGASLGVFGGMPPYSWVEDTSFSGRGDFDLSGLTIDMSSGIVRGTPFNSASGKTLRFRVIVKDSLGDTTSGAEAIFTITVH